MQKSVLIIGAGASGLPALKTALEYGFTAVCMEKSTDMGGLWRYKPHPAEDEGTVMRSTVINTSKEMTAYSDFPPPKDASNYMHNSEMLEYLRSYAAHFDLAKHILFRHQVLNVERAESFPQNGRWLVTSRSLECVADQRLFDGVMVCTGHHTHAHWPTPPFPGQGLFEGKLMHSHSYNSSSSFTEDQVVVVVGIGNSGGDIAVELSKVVKKVYLATRSGSWVFNRVWDRGEPSDLALLTRFVYGVRSIAPLWMQNAIFERKVERRFDHGRYGLRPSHRILEAHLTINDELPNRIISGTVVVKPNIEKFTKQGLCFEDGTSLAKVDMVIFATGYSFSFPELEHGRLINVEENAVLLYKHMFPVDLAPHNSLAIIGLIQPTGSIMPISEMQTRLFCASLAGDIALPSSEKMLEDAKRTLYRCRRRFVGSRRHTIQVEYVNYMRVLAKLMGVEPRIWKRLVGDPSLTNRLLFHGLVPYQFRLDGPHAWSGARQAIMGVNERVFNATRTRNTRETERSRPPWKLYYVLRMFV